MSLAPNTHLHSALFGVRHAGLAWKSRNGDSPLRSQDWRG